MKPLEKECARCGACAVVCPVYRAVGRESLTARGKQVLLGSERAVHPSAEFRDIFAQCLLCGACESTCPRGLSTVGAVVEARSRFSEPYGRHGARKALLLSVLARPWLLRGLIRAGLTPGRLFSLPVDSGLWLKLGLSPGGATGGDERAAAERKLGGSSGGRAEFSYFPGCFARYAQGGVAEASLELFRLVAGNEVVAPGAAGCCGLAAHAAGRLKQARRLARRNISAFEKTGGLILTSCASCYSHLQNYRTLLANDAAWRGRAEAFSARVREFSEFMLERAEPRIFAAAGEPRVLYHEPCHLRFSDRGNNGAAGATGAGSARNGAKAAPSRLIDSVRHARRVEPQGGGRCCGQGGLFHVGYPEAAGKIFQACHDAALGAAPDLIVTTCSGCLMQWRAGLAARKSRMRVMHLAAFLAQCYRK